MSWVVLITWEFRNHRGSALSVSVLQHLAQGFGGLPVRVFLTD